MCDGDPAPHVLIDRLERGLSAVWRLAGANKGAFVQAYNVEMAVDAEAQVIVAVDVVQATNDARQLVPMCTAVVRNVGRLADVTSGDAGFFSAENIAHPVMKTTRLLVPPDRQKHGAAESAGVPTSESVADRMRRTLAEPEAQALYKMRKAIVEPVFGQIKHVRGLRQLLIRGLLGARGEMALIALTHNILKLPECRLRRPRPPSFSF